MLGGWTLTKLWRYEGWVFCKNSVCNWQEFAFDASSCFEPMDRARDSSGMTGFRNLDNSTWKRVLDLLDAGYLRLRKVVVRRTTFIEFGLNDWGGSRGCIGTDVRADTAELNMLTAMFQERWNLACSSKIKPRLRAEWVVLSEELCILPSWFAQ